MKRQTGKVGIEKVGNKLRLRLPRNVGTANRYINTGLDDSPDNLKRVQLLAWDIEGDIAIGKLQPSPNYLERFKPETPKTPDTPITLAELWAKYCDYKQHQLSSTTYTQDYCKKWANHIANLPQSLDKAVAIRDSLISKVTLDTAKRLLTLISACCNWAVKSGLLTANPFSGMASDLTRPKTSKDIHPFSPIERDAILEAFRNHRNHRHYQHFVEFLFLTGCRTGEAIALKWKHVANDFSSITFAQSYSSKLKISKGTKTGKVRKFPCNAMLRTLLASIKPSDAKPEQLVFTSPTGLPINNSKFTNQVWKGCKVGKKSYKGILSGLVEDGSIDVYRCLYNTRHTFITLMLEAGLTIPQVAKLVGNSPEILLKHYAGNSVLEIPIV
jgi:integrase